MSQRPAGGKGVVPAMAICLIVLITYAGSSATRTTHGFISYYAAARLLLDGQLGPDAYDDAWFGRYVRAVTGTGVLEIFIPNPPMMALFAALYFVPLAATAEVFTRGWSILAAYPRLYAAWLLWALAIHAMYQAARGTTVAGNPTAHGVLHAPAV